MSPETLFDTGKKRPIAAYVDGYLEYLRTERSASHYTTLNYEIDLRHWLKFLYEEKSAVTLEHLGDLKILRKFLAQELDKYEKSTVSRRLSVIKGFLKFLHREGAIEKNVAKLIALPKKTEKLPNVLKAEDAIRLIESIPTHNLKFKRIRAMVELLYSAGLRVSELVQLNQGHVDLRRGFVVVRGKGNKERAVPIGRHCQKAIGDYIDSLPRSQQGGPETPVFMNREGTRLSVRTAQRDLKAFAIEVLGTQGIEVSPHTLRHSCATHLLAGGAGLREIQELLGHKTLVTTQKYTHVDIQRLKASYKRSHPKEKKRSATDNEETS